MVPKWIVVSLDQCQQANCVRPAVSVLCCDIIISLSVCAKLHKNVERTTSFLCVFADICGSVWVVILKKTKVKMHKQIRFHGLTR